MSSSALGPGAIAQATGVSSDKAQAVHAFLTSTGDEAVFACSATKLSSGTDRLVLVSRYRLLLVRWKFRRAAFRELRLLDLRGITDDYSAMHSLGDFVSGMTDRYAVKVRDMVAGRI